MSAHIVIKYKPLSVNEVWKGKRYRTKAYDKYERDMLFLLPKIKVPDGKLYIEMTFGFSNSKCDIDNPIKPFFDILQKKYGFDDKMIYKTTVNKHLVKRGAEFVMFKIHEFIGNYEGI